LKLNNKPASNKSIPIEEESSLKYKDYNNSNNQKSYGNDEDVYNFSGNNRDLGSINSTSNNNILKQMNNTNINRSKNSEIKEEVKFLKN
jgi:hypothetical protein